MERQFNAHQTPRSIYLSVFNNFRVIRCLSQCMSPKNRYFYHIFVSPGDAPGAITLNVVWMEREFDAYKLSRCMCPCDYYRFWDTARYLWKNRHFIIPLAFDGLVGGFPSEYRHPLWYGKTRIVSLPDGEKFRRYVYSFWPDPRTWQTDRQTDGQTDRRTLHDSKDRACIASRGKIVTLTGAIFVYCVMLTWYRSMFMFTHGTPHNNLVQYIMRL